MWNDWTWPRVCCTLKHLVDLYQASLEKKKRKKCREASCACQDNDPVDPSNLTSLDVVDFFKALEEKIDTIGGTTNVSFDFVNI